MALKSRSYFARHTDGDVSIVRASSLSEARRIAHEALSEVAEVTTSRPAASYVDGVRWIAYNDEPSDRNEARVAGFISTLLLADLFHKSPGIVARAIVRLRRKDNV